jgi:hypothetical protein
LRKTKRKVQKKTKAKKYSKKTNSNQFSDLRLLELLINKFIDKLEKNGFEPKAQDVLKAIQLKQKLAKSAEAEKLFWELLDELRDEELGKKTAKTERNKD